MLSPDQQSDLEKAIHEYLSLKNYAQTADRLLAESPVLKGVAPAPSGENLLERKWLTILRLQAKIVELERKQAATEEILSKSVRNLKALDGPEDAAKAQAGALKSPVLKLNKAYKGHKEPVNAVAVHLAEPFFATASSDSTIRVYDYELQSQMAVLKGHTHSVNCVAWGKESLLSGSSDMTIKLWRSLNKTNAFDFAEFSCVKTMIGHEHSVSFLLHLPDTDLVLSASRDKTVRLWDKSTGFGKRTIAGVHDDWVRTLDANARHLVSSGNDKKLFVFDLNKVLQTEGKDSANSLSLLVNAFEAHENYIESVKVLKKSKLGEDETIAFTASRDKYVGVWNYLKSTCLVLLKGHENWVKDLALIEDPGFVISVGEDKTVRIWDYRKKKPIFVEKAAHEHFVSSVVFHAEFRVLVTGSVDKTSKVWKVANSTSQDLVQSIA